MESYCKSMEREAMGLLGEDVFNYGARGAMDEYSLGDAVVAFKRYKLKPRDKSDLHDDSIDSKIRFQFSSSDKPTEFNFPFGIAPLALERLFHPSGSYPVMKAAQSLGICGGRSFLSSDSIELTATDFPKLEKWQQINILKPRCVSEDIIKRAESVGFKALMLGCDRPVSGISYRPPIKYVADNIKCGNFNDKHLKMFENYGFNTSRLLFGLPVPVDKCVDETFTWNDISWIRSITKLPIILKGILRKDDAAMSIDVGADGIVVSAHGCRQLDGAPAPLDALVEIVDEVRGRIPVFMDGGVRCGEDVVKAIALGARLVFLGRAWLWPLAAKGEDGVNEVLNLLCDEIMATMKKYGYPNIQSICRSDIYRCT